MLLNCLKITFINDFVNDINDQISFQAIPMTQAKPFSEQLC